MQMRKVTGIPALPGPWAQLEMQQKSLFLVLLKASGQIWDG